MLTIFKKLYTYLISSIRKWYNRKTAIKSELLADLQQPEQKKAIFNEQQETPLHKSKQEKLNPPELIHTDKQEQSKEIPIGLKQAFKMLQQEKPEPREYKEFEKKQDDPKEPIEVKLDSKQKKAKQLVGKSQSKHTGYPINKPKPKLIEPLKEEHSSVKYIGYNPVNIFAQTEPLYFPYVIMPKPKCVIKFPRKGRAGRKGYKEDYFKSYITKYLSAGFQFFDDRFILIKNTNKPFEPDFTLIDEKSGINIFLDIEIDEPYEGINDIENRNATHFQFADINRNNAFKNRGWIVIRFAEIQVHQEPESCCRFIADVIKSIHQDYTVPDELVDLPPVKIVKQWTKEEADQWSKEKYRENYLGITNFGISSETCFQESVTETEIGNEIEQQVKEEPLFITPTLTKIASPYIVTIQKAIASNLYISLTYQDYPCIVKPISVDNVELIAFCYIKNKERCLLLSQIFNPIIKENYFTMRVASPILGLDKVTNVINTAISYNKYIRMNYTRTAWNRMYVDPDTGEIILESVDSEESTRTISNIQLSINALSIDELRKYRLDSNYITAYCHKREEQRTFRFDRISEIEILDL